MEAVYEYRRLANPAGTCNREISKGIVYGVFSIPISDITISSKSQKLREIEVKGLFYMRQNDGLEQSRKCDPLF